MWLWRRKFRRCARRNISASVRGGPIAPRRWRYCHARGTTRSQLPAMNCPVGNERSSRRRRGEEPRAIRSAREANSASSRKVESYAVSLSAGGGGGHAAFVGHGQLAV